MYTHTHTPRLELQAKTSMERTCRAPYTTLLGSAYVFLCLGIYLSSLHWELNEDNQTTNRKYNSNVIDKSEWDENGALHWKHARIAFNHSKLSNWLMLRKWETIIVKGFTPSPTIRYVVRWSLYAGPQSTQRNCLHSEHLKYTRARSSFSHITIG